MPITAFCGGFSLREHQDFVYWNSPSVLASTLKLESLEKMDARVGVIRKNFRRLHNVFGCVLVRDQWGFSHQAFLIPLV